MKGILVESYTEKGYKPIPSVRLSDKAYGRGLQCFVPLCVDVVPVNKRRKLIYLALRRLKPAAGWWWVGGRMTPHETKEEAAVRVFKRETGFEVSPERLELVAVLDYRWKDREQQPKNIGCHTVGLTYVIDMTEEEIALVSKSLDESEYQYFDSEGLYPFDRERLELERERELEKERVSQQILDLYAHLFD